MHALLTDRIICIDNIWILFSWCWLLFPLVMLTLAWATWTDVLLSCQVDVLTIKTVCVNTTLTETAPTSWTLRVHWSWICANKCLFRIFFTVSLSSQADNWQTLNLLTRSSQVNDLGMSGTETIPQPSLWASVGSWRKSKHSRGNLELSVETDTRKQSSSIFSYK